MKEISKHIVVLFLVLSLIMFTNACKKNEEPTTPKSEETQVATNTAIGTTTVIGTQTVTATQTETETQIATPTATATKTPFYAVKIACGYGHSLALKSDKGVWATGRGNVK